MTTRKPDDHRTADDRRIDAAWRAASREEPPPALDAAIRAAARREVGAGPQRTESPVPEATSPERWWWPLAAAATIGAIALGLLQIVGTPGGGEPAGGPAVVSDMPEGTRAAASPQPDAALRREDTAAKTVQKPAAETADPPLRTREPRPQPPMPGRVESPVPRPAAAPPAPAPLESIEAARPGGAAKLASPAPVLAPAPAPRAEARSPVPLPVTEWIARIRRLRDEGRIDEAAKELAAFRAAHADHETLLPPDLRDWKPAPG